MLKYAENEDYGNPQFDGDPAQDTHENDLIDGICNTPREFRTQRENGFLRSHEADMRNLIARADKILSAAPRAAVRLPRSAPRARAASKGASQRASEKSGDGNASDPDPDPARPARRLLDQAALAQFLCISKKTLQNQYSSAPHTLPAAISIPGARGPRWTQASVQAWLEQRPQHKHTSKPTPPAPQRKVGRPRIARIALVRSKGGAA
ncbi:hypothetical protein HF668_02485 [Acidithiobacillus ferridurans]|uniref:helix-turn-helix transcriptional regulator n=1 Tax=Acidithiobacillus ferridurans TaxID=1232575 RepID=UPI001C06D98F|nr:hypothetical protein [Acidithiobacillus ferridurans]MBU2804045.1 hypothetical protein [Acidithiobacillus ferridurans]